MEQDEKIIWLIPVVTSVIIIILIFINILRNGFYIKVNCWFCNSWTKVLFQQRNSFVCPECLQYNGFNEDGGYNKIIPEQHIKGDSSTGFTRQTKPKLHVKSTNGLCSYCNYKQELKIRQLSLFEPLNEDEFDRELAHFKKNLDKVYDLCKTCKVTVKHRIAKQNVTLFGKGLKLINQRLNEINLKRKYFISLTFLNCILIFCSVLILLSLLDDKLRKFIAEDAWMVWERNKMYVPYFGAGSQIILTIFDNKDLFWTRAYQLLSWSCLITSQFAPDFYLASSLQVICCQIIIISTLLDILNINVFKPQRNSVSKARFIKLSHNKWDNSTFEAADDDNSSSTTSYSSLSEFSYVSKCKTWCSNNSQVKRTAPLFKDLKNKRMSLNDDLNDRLSSLSLSEADDDDYKSQIQLNSDFDSRSTASPWTAGGFWMNNHNLSPTKAENLSRSSSQTSGFISNHSHCSQRNLFKSGCVKNNNCFKSNNSYNGSLNDLNSISNFKNIDKSRDYIKPSAFKPISKPISRPTDLRTSPLLSCFDNFSFGQDGNVESIHFSPRPVINYSNFELQMDKSTNCGRSSYFQSNSVLFSPPSTKSTAFSCKTLQNDLPMFDKIDEENRRISF